MPNTTGAKYQLSFKNRENDNYSVVIYPKNYQGDIIQLEGTDNPFTWKAQSGDGDTLSPVRASEAVIEFWSNGVKLTDFYSDDDTFFLVKLWEDETVKWQGFLIIDNCADAYQDTSHLLSLNANDNLGLLEKIDFRTGFINSTGVEYTKSVEFRNSFDGAKIIIQSTVIPEIAAGASLVFRTGINAGTYTIISFTYDGTYYICEVGAYIFTLITAVYTFLIAPSIVVPEQMLLTEILDVILFNTTLDLPVAAYLNIFENSTDDRSIVDTNDLLQQTIVTTNNLLTDATTYKSCFEILRDLMTTLKATIFQSLQAQWVIVRFPEYMYFAGALPGTLYTSRMVVDSAITLAPGFNISPTGNVIPINENQINRIQRPYQFVKKTFNFVQPAQLILQSDLSIPATAVPFNTFNIGSIQYKDYSLAAYFQKWVQTHDDGSYLEIATDTITGNETERYIVTPTNLTYTYKGVQFNPIAVSAPDSFDFSLSFRTESNESVNYSFTIRFILVTPANTYYNLTVFPGSGSTVNVHWTGPFAVAGWDSFAGDPLVILGSSDTTQWTQWTLSGFVETHGALPKIPTDGILLIEVRGNNSTNMSEPLATTYWNNINIDFKLRQNQFTNIQGQVHLQEQNTPMKNNVSTDIVFDDSPHNTISGTLLRTPLVTFGANIGDLYFYKTLSWHRGTADESLRLGQITAFDELFIQRKPRTIVEGDFRGISNLSLESAIAISFIPGKNFILGVSSVNFMTAIWNATLYELYDNDEVPEDLDNVYVFRYLYGG